MTDAETIEAARRLFASDTPGDKLARRLLAIAERERDCVGFWIESDEIAPTDADSPSPCHRIGLALIRLAYAVALVSMTRSKP